MGLSGSDVVTVMLHALAAVVTVFLVGSVGYIGALYPKHDPFLAPSSLRTLSRLTNFVLIPPIIISSIASSISTSQLSRMGILIFFSFITIGISYLLAFTLGTLIVGKTLKPRLKYALGIAIGSPNIISFPLMVIQTLCTQADLNQDYNHSSSQCFSEGTSMLFIYSIGWNLIFWSYGYPGLASLHTMTDEALPVANSWKKMVNFLYSDDLVPETYSWARKVLLSPNMVAIYIAIFIGLIDPLRNQIFGSNTVLSPIGESLITLGQPVVCLSSLVMYASLAKVKLFNGHEQTSDYKIFSEESTSHDLEEHSNQGDMVTRSSHTHEGGSENGDHFEQPHWRANVALFICRLIIPGIIVFPILEVFVHSGWINQSERLLQFVIILEAVAPPAQTIIVSLNQLGLLDIAGSMAYLYIFQYFATILTITAWVTFTLSVI